MKMRIDLQTGTQVGFTAADKVNLLTKALQNQTIGVVGQQYIAKNVNDQTANALKALTQQNLADLCTQISQLSSSTVQYAHLAYDIEGNTVTNYYLGLVTRINYVPNNGQDIANAIHASPLGYITDQFASYGYEAYIIGNPPMGTFHFKQTITAETKNWLPRTQFQAQFASEEIGKQELSNQVIAQAQSKFQQAYNEQGYNVTVISATLTETTLLKRLAVAGMMRDYEYGFRYTIEIVLDSDKAFQNSPIAPLVIVAFGLAIALIAAAIVVPLAISEWLKSMTTKTWTSKQTTYGWVKNPNTGEYEWKETETKEESGTSPDLGGIFTTGTIIGIFGLVALLMVIYFVLGRKK
jgi:hypothetical protein